jgi:CrcB protein
VLRTSSIAAFGLLGVFSRYFLGQLATRHLSPPFPWGTFLINIIGAFLIGVVYVVGAERSALSEDLRIGIMVGFLGGFTTFSSYCLESATLLETAKFGYAALYFFVSPLLGLAACFGGLALTRVLFMLKD